MTRKRKLKIIRRIRRVRDEINSTDNFGRKKHLFWEYPGVLKLSFTGHGADVEMEGGYEYTSSRFFLDDQITELSSKVYRHIIDNLNP